MVIKTFFVWDVTLIGYVVLVLDVGVLDILNAMFVMEKDIYQRTMMNKKLSCLA